MSKILVICPSRERPQLCKEMYTSFIKTAKIADILVVVDSDDPTRDQYQCPRVLEPPTSKTITNIFNVYYSLMKDKYDYFMCGNDDFLYHTDGWDVKLAQRISDKSGWAISYPRNDMNEKLPMTSLIPTNILECVGWLQLPTLTHLCGDCVWRDIGSAINRLVYCPDIFIEHMHFMNNKMIKDEVYEKTNSEEMYKKDNDAYREWIKTDKQRCVDLVLQRMWRRGVI